MGLGWLVNVGLTMKVTGEGWGRLTYIKGSTLYLKSFGFKSRELG